MRARRRRQRLELERARRQARHGRLARHARATVDALNAASGAAPGSANYWGYDSAGAVAGIQAIAYGLNNVAEYNFPEDRDFQADIFLGAVNWEIGNLMLSSNTSLVEYDKEDWLDPDDSSFAVFNDHRLEDFEQTAQELRLTSPLDQKLSWMVGLYYQQHDLLSRIDVYLPRLLGTAAYQPAGARAVGFGGLLTEDSEWQSAFFATTWNVADAFRVNLGGRYQDAEKDGRLPAEAAFLVGSDGDEFSPFATDPRRAKRRHSGRRDRRSRRLPAGGGRRVGHERRRDGVREVCRGVQERRLRDVAAGRRRLARSVHLRARVREGLRDRAQEPARSTTASS